MNDIVMPRLSDSMTEGTVVRWLKRPGDAIARGEPLAEIETDKATITYESDLDGVLAQILVGEGQTVPVGTQIAIIQPAGAPAQPGPLPTPGPLPVPGPLPTPDQPAGPPPLPTPAPQQPGPPPLATPPAEHQAPPPLPTPQASPPPLQPPPSQQPPPLQPPAEEPYDRSQFEQEFASTGEYESFNDAPAAPTPPPLQPPAEDFPVDDSFAQTGEYDTGEYGTTGEFQTGEYAAAGQQGERIKASPIARRLARRLGVDIAAIQGTGPDGRVVKEDVEAAADAAAQRAAQMAPTQAPAPQPGHYAYEPGEVEQQEDAQFSQAAHQMEQPQPPAPEPPLIPHFPPPPQQQPMPMYPPQPQPYPGQGPVPPGYGPPGYNPYGQPMYPPQPQQPFPAPPPFVQGMTGNFPAVERPQQQQQPPQAPPPGAAPTATRGHSTPIQPTSAQQTVARRMAESKATAPEFFVETEVDMTMAVAFREQLRGAVEPLPSFNDFVFKASALALKQYPNVNAAYKDGHFEQYSDVNIGMVVSATDLLAVPTLFNVDQKGLAQIARESHELADAVRNRTIQPAQMSGGTFSISNLGMYGVERFTAILNPPQAAILAVGAITRKAVIAEDGMSLVVRQMMAMTLTCDHRILYGAEAAEFLAAIKAWLENPQMLQI